MWGQSSQFSWLQQYREMEDFKKFLEQQEKNAKPKPSWIERKFTLFETFLLMLFWGLASSIPVVITITYGLAHLKEVLNTVMK
jgi:hypothetical protein